MPTISVFKNVKEVNNPTIIDFEEFLDCIKNGEWEDDVNKVRTQKEKSKRDEIKRTLRTITISGLFTKREDKSLIEHSGFISMDIDEIPEGETTNSIKDKLSKDKYCHSIFLSTSGVGLRYISRIDPERHRDAFMGLSKYLYDTYNIIVDPNGINVSKPYVVSYDPDLRRNNNHIKFTAYIKETKIVAKFTYFNTPSDFKEVYRNITQRNISICDEYADWYKLGLALADCFGEEGRSYFHELSSISSKYSYGRVDKQYDYCLRSKGHGINMATFYFLAKRAGVPIVSEQTKKVYRITRSGKKAGLSEAQINENLKKFSDIHNVEKLVTQIFNQDDDELIDDSPVEQLEMFITNNYRLEYNCITGYIEDDGRRMEEFDLNSIYIQAKKLIPKIDFQLMMRLLRSDFVPKYNPFLRFFNIPNEINVRLPAIPIHQDEEDYPSPLINKLADTLVTEKPMFTRYFVKKWYVSIIASMMGEHSPLFLCLLGRKQGTGKTEWFRRLLPRELVEYYAESKLDRDKDDEILMCEKIIIMDDELAGKTKRDNIKLKNITSKSYFYVRRPYGSTNEKLKRIAVLCGTSNILEILTDTTGNRRVIPIKIIDIDKVEYNKIDKKALLMEAFELYKKGFDWRVTYEDAEFLNEGNEEFTTQSIESELILQEFRIPKQGEAEEQYSTSEVLVTIEKITKQKISMQAVTEALNHIGFKKRTIRDESGSSKKVWLMKRIIKDVSQLTETDVTKLFTSGKEFGAKKDKEDIKWDGW